MDSVLSLETTRLLLSASGLLDARKVCAGLTVSGRLPTYQQEGLPSDLISQNEEFP